MTVRALLLLLRGDVLRCEALRCDAMKSDTMRCDAVRGNAARVLLPLLLRLRWNVGVAGADELALQVLE
jgi:hypothetical protein